MSNPHIGAGHRATVQKLGGLAAAIAVALAAAAGVGAHSGAPFWSKADAERHATLGPVQLGRRTVRADKVDCFGNGRIRIRVKGVLKYQHFDCLVTPSRERRFWIYLHPLPRGWTYEFRRYG